MHVLRQLRGHWMKGHTSAGLSTKDFGKAWVSITLGFWGHGCCLCYSGPWRTDSPGEEEPVQTQPEAEWRWGYAYHPNS